MDNLDKLLKDKLANEQFSFEEADWSAALNQLNEKPMRKKGFWYWISALILILTVSTLVYSMVDINRKTIAQNQTTTSKTNQSAQRCREGTVTPLCFGVNSAPHNHGKTPAQWTARFAKKALTLSVPH